MTFEQIVSGVKKKEYQPIYFLHGTEDYFIDAISDLIEERVLNESEKAFNQALLYGKETSHLAVLDQARRYPMMSKYQVVVIKEAQEMKSLKELQGYVENPTPSTILVICHKHKKLNMNTVFGKKLKAKAVVLDSKPLYDNQVPDWISKYLKGKKLSISPKAAGIIADYLGTKLSKIVNELDKLAINVPAGSEVTDVHVEKYIGISKDYNVFELQRALTNRDVLKANRIANYFAANPKKGPMPVVVSALYNFFSKVYMIHFLRNLSEQEVLQALNLRSPYFLKEYRLAARNFNHAKTEQIISILKTYDLKSKGVDYISTGKPEGELLREMIWKLLH
jgi:DNA polymerase-3 subunit delta